MCFWARHWLAQQIWKRPHVEAFTGISGTTKDKMQDERGGGTSAMFTGVRAQLRLDKWDPAQHQARVQFTVLAAARPREFKAGTAL